jgi:Rod binding domain-containing protein
MPIQSVAALAAIRPASALSFATRAPASAAGSPGAAAASPGSKDTPEKIQKAATDFEALLIAQMLKSARESEGGVTGDADEQDETNSTMLELGEQQLAQALSSSGGLGIAKMVIAGLTNHANR